MGVEVWLYAFRTAALDCQLLAPAALSRGMGTGTRGIGGWMAN